MKKSFGLFAGIIALALLAGCETTGVDNRIKEMPTLFGSLPPWKQENVRKGIFEIGDPTEIIYLTLGQPSRIVTSADGKETTWTYLNYYPLWTKPVPSAHVRTEGGPYYSPVIVSANAPRSGKSLSDTGIKGTVQTSLDVPDLPPDTLFVIFHGNKVYDAMLESQQK